MILPFIYLAFIIGWIILIFAYYIQDWTIKSIVSLFFMVLGTYTLINGIEGINNIATIALASIHTVVGFYIIATESYELYKDM